MRRSLVDKLDRLVETAAPKKKSSVIAFDKKVAEKIEQFIVSEHDDEVKSVKVEKGKFTVEKDGYVIRLTLRGDAKYSLSGLEIFIKSLSKTLKTPIKSHQIDIIGGTPRSGLEFELQVYYNNALANELKRAFE